MAIGVAGNTATWVTLLASSATRLSVVALRNTLLLAATFVVAIAGAASVAGTLTRILALAMSDSNLLSLARNSA